jgi:thiol-disulfide isomerase/thioredoxin
VRRASILLFALLVGACSTPAPSATPSPQPPVPFASCAGITGGSAKLPDIALPCFNGGEPVQVGQLRGPMVINFWASWCAPCRSELPAFQRLADSQRVPVIGVDTDDRRDEAIAVATELGVRFPALFDAGGQLRRAQGAPGLPLTLFVGAQGEVSAYSGPALTDETLGRLVAERLGVGP